jgi:hypothetical protein
MSSKEIFDKELRGEVMSNKEMFEKELQFVTHHKGFKLVDPHLGVCPERSSGEAKMEKPSCPIRFEGKALLGKKIVVYVPKKYCEDGTVSRERLATDGFCGFAERSKELHDCRMVFKPNATEQWRIEIME